MHEWIKLHTALRSSEIYKDINAKVVFMHLLIVADNQGNGRISRYMTASELGMNPNTFKSALQRCAKKYDLCTLSSTNKFSDFSLKNWSKYQTLDTNKTPARHQQDTSQTPLYKEEIKNKKKIISKDIGSTEPNISKIKVETESKKNKCVDHAIAEFTRIYKFHPTDKKVRNVAYNLVQRMQTVIKTKLGGYVSEERVMTGITRLFNWISRNESFSNIQKLETIKLKMSIWEANLKGTYATNERKDYSGEGEQTPISTIGDQAGGVLRTDRPNGEKEDSIFYSSVLQTTGIRASGNTQGLGSLLPTMRSESRSNAVSRDEEGIHRKEYNQVQRTAPASPVNARNWDRKDANSQGIRPDGMGQLGLGDTVSDDNLGVEQGLGTTRHDDRRGL